MIRKIGYLLLILLLLAGVLLVAWYRVDGLPRPEADQYLHGAGFRSREFPDGSFVFTPATPNGHGLLIMHGALIKPLSYARTAAYFAQRGYTVFLPCGRFRLSILAVDDAAARLGEFGVRDWFLIGHSMGGFSSLTLLRDHAVNVRAVALWAAAMPGDFSALRVPMLFLWGDRDGLLPPERLADARSKLPATTRYLTLPGGNHQDFALYTHQFFDNPGSLGWEQQIGRADEETAAFFASQE